MNPDNLLPGLPRVESPLFPHLLKNGTFCGWDSLALQVHEQGYGIIDLGADWVAPLAAEIRSSLLPAFDFASWRTEQSRGGLRIQDAWRDLEAVRQLALAPVVLEVLTLLFGRRPYPFQTLNFPVGSQQHFHSDAVHFQSDPPGFMCGVWIALEDIDLDAGPLEFYPGSHRLPFLQARDVGYSQQPGREVSQEIFHPAWQAMVRERNLIRELYTPKLGQALIWSANFLHGGSVVRNHNLSRWSQVTHYFFDGCLTYTPMASDWPLGPVAWRTPWDVERGEHLASQAPLNLENRLKEFNPEEYLKANPDVAAVGRNAYEHLLLHGLEEDRPWQQS